MAERNPYLEGAPGGFEPADRLSAEEARRQVEQLREAIEHHDYLYYLKSSPRISDAVYDRLFRRLQELEQSHPELQSETSPTRKVGAPPVDALKKVRHTRPMLSLSSALEEGEAQAFDRFVRRNVEDGVRYVVEPKFDGLSVEVVYQEGELRYGATRGDGTTGEDISQNLKTIRSLPLHLRSEEAPPSFLAVRAEVLMSREGFQRLNRRRIERNEEPFANPRNAAAGIMRQLDSRNAADKPLDIYFYDILTHRGEEYPSHWELLQAFRRWGLKTADLNRLCRDFAEIRAYRSELAGKREELPYEIDGIVIKLDDRRAREELGARQRSPRWAFAWKFPPKREITILQEIVVQVGRTGILTPVALLDPVEVGGVTVSRATLHNQDEVERKDVRPGDRVRVQRAGDVIPEVVERLKEPGKKRWEPFSMPKACPVCGTPVEREGAYVLCPAGLSCPAQRIGRMVHYASRGGLDIATLGEKNVRRLVEKGLVQELPDLYRLAPEQIQELEGFAEKSARKLHQAIQGSLRPPLERFLYALGIRHVGEHVASVLARHFGSLEALRRADLEELEAVPEIGPEIAETVHHFFSEEQNQRILGELEAEGLKVREAPRRRASGALAGKTFVFTGELAGYTRQEAQRRVEALGARATPSVSGNTDYLVAGEGPGSKLEQARKRKVEILDQEQFEKLLAQAEG